MKWCLHEKRQFITTALRAAAVVAFLLFAFGCCPRPGYRACDGQVRLLEYKSAERCMALAGNIAVFSPDGHFTECRPAPKIKEIIK